MPDSDMGAPYDVVAFPTPNDTFGTDEIFISEGGSDQIGWNGDSPSHTKAWKVVDGKRVAYIFQLGWGFMTDNEIWEERQKYPRDCF